MLKGSGWGAVFNLQQPHCQPEKRPGVNRQKVTIVQHTQCESRLMLINLLSIIFLYLRTPALDSNHISHIKQHTDHSPTIYSNALATKTHHRTSLDTTAITLTITFNMGKSKNGRKIPDTYFARVNMNGYDRLTINRLYNEGDTKALDSIGAKVFAFPSRCFRSTPMWKPAALQDRRCWRETKPKAPSSLRECEVASE